MPLTGITTTTHAYRYGSERYGFMPYGGLAPATVVPTRNVSGILFLSSNDRYQVVACAYGGSLGVAPEFRYWYSSAPSWAEELNGDSYIPPYYAADEDGTVPTGSLELPYRRVKSPQEMTIDGVTVEFVCRPSSLTANEALATSNNCTFTVTVEAQGVAGYEYSIVGKKTGIVRSDAHTFSEAVDAHSDTYWPNVRTEFFPTRIQTRTRAARVILSSIQLVEILSVNLIGKTSIPDRNA